MTDPRNHAAGNPGEDPSVEDVDRKLTKGGDAEKRAIDPFENPEEEWTGPGRRHGDLHDGLDPDTIPDSGGNS